MKAVVLEVRDGEAAILTMDGTVRRVRGDYDVGQEIEYVVPGRFPALRWVAAVLVAAILLTGSAGMWINSNYIAYAEVSLDVNPSIVYTLNRRNRVLSVSAVNEDGAAIVEAIQRDGVRFMPIDDAVERTLGIMSEEGYLNAEAENYVLAGVSADDERVKEALAGRVEAAMDRAREALPPVEYRIERTDRDTAREARENGMSPGRYAAWKAAPEGREPAEFAEMPVGEIMGKGAPEARDGGDGEGMPVEAVERDGQPAGREGEAPSVDGGETEPRVEAGNRTPEVARGADSPAEDGADAASGQSAGGQGEAPSEKEAPAARQAMQASYTEGKAAPSEGLVRQAEAQESGAEKREEASDSSQGSSGAGHEEKRSRSGDPEGSHEGRSGERSGPGGGEHGGPGGRE